MATWTLAQAGAGQACHRARQRETEGSALRASYTKTVYLLQVEEIQPLSGKVTEMTLWGASLLCTRCRAGSGIGWAWLAYRRNPLQLSVHLLSAATLVWWLQTSFPTTCGQKRLACCGLLRAWPIRGRKQTGQAPGRVGVWALGPCRREAHEGLPVWAPQATESRREPGGT